MQKFFILIFILLIISVSHTYSNENKSDIEKTIENYILENPEIIIKSLEKYSRKKQEEEKKSITINLKDFYEKELFKKLPSIGIENSDLILVEFIDYNCGYCKKTLLTISKLLDNFKNLKIVFVDFPILSESSELAARAALAANKQGYYFKFHTILLQNNKPISENYLLEAAKSLDLNIKRFKKDMNSTNIRDTITSNIELAKGLQIRGTPTFIIKDQILPGAYDYDKLSNIILNKS